tara:strand:+ start:771 stop:1541 length:771 start_codon:yes stop_codon:yes gene_type:complete
LIEKLGSLVRLAKADEIIVILRENVSEQGCKAYCHEHQIHHIENNFECGFSRNNNLNFLHAVSLGIQPEDYFIVLNPDVYISSGMIKKLVSNLSLNRLPLVAPNLYLDNDKTTFDDNIRTYPSLRGFIKNYLLNDRSTVLDKTKPQDLPRECWASGAFLAVQASLYQKLDGFDERYFMYCEDLDFCLRANRQGDYVSFLSSVDAIHYRQRSSQRFLSKAFFQHVRSVFLYLSARREWRRHISCLQRIDLPLNKKRT